MNSALLPGGTLHAKLRTTGVTTALDPQKSESFDVGEAYQRFQEPSAPIDPARNHRNNRYQ